MPGVVVVVDRIGLRLSDDVAIHDIAGTGQSQLHQLPRGQGDQLGIGRVPESIPLEAEVFEAVAGQRRIGHELWRPAAEVLHPPDLHARLVDVNPVVVERERRLHDQRHGQELAILQRRGGRPRLRARGRLEAEHQLPQRRRGDHMIGGQALPLSRRVDGVNLPATGRADEPGRSAAHPDLAPLLHRPPRGGLPHHARSLPRITERADECLDLLRPILRLPLGHDGVPDRACQRQPLDPLRRPIGRDLLAAHAPHLLGVGLEKDAEQPAAELVRDPVLERPRIADREDPGPAVAGDAPHGLHEPQVLQGLGRPQRIGVKLAAIENPRTAGPDEHVAAEQFGPQIFHFLRLREEAVAADIEPKTFVCDRPGDAPDELRIGLEHGHRRPGSREEVGGREPGRAGPDDCDSSGHTRDDSRTGCENHVCAPPCAPPVAKRRKPWDLPQNRSDRRKRCGLHSPHLFLTGQGAADCRRYLYRL